MPFGLCLTYDLSGKRNPKTGSSPHSRSDRRDNDDEDGAASSDSKGGPSLENDGSRSELNRSRHSRLRGPPKPPARLFQKVKRTTHKTRLREEC